MPLFNLGQVVATPSALDVLEQRNINPATLIARHACGDFGDLDPEDLKANENALAYGARIFSAYHCGEDKIWIITTADRSSTCILLPSDY